MKKHLVLLIVFTLFILAGCATAPAPLPPAPETALPEGKIEIDEVFVEGGSFQMGDAWGGENPDGTPVHSVTLSGFYMAVHEVSQSIYERVMGSNPSAVKAADLPVGSVTWHEAVEFCNRLSERNGYEKVYTVNGTSVSMDRNAKGYRLPTESEWEYAARSKGRNDRQWSGTNKEKEIEDYAWYYWDDPAPHPIGTKKPNELGLYDMTGNLEEWCWDWYGPYTKSAKTNPTGPSSGTYRCGRGGAWNWDADYSRTVRRDGFTPAKNNPVLGFRVVRRSDE